MCLGADSRLVLPDKMVSPVYLIGAQQDWLRGWYASGLPVAREDGSHTLRAPAVTEGRFSMAHGSALGREAKFILWSRTAKTRHSDVIVGRPKAAFRLNIHRLQKTPK